MSLDISDEEYEELKKLRDEDGDLTILECDSDLNLRFLERGYADGETYIPSVVFDEIDSEALNTPPVRRIFRSYNGNNSF